MSDAALIRTPLDCAVRAELRDTVAVMGNMDGVHLGHQALIARAQGLAQEMERPLSAIVFDPHPRLAFAPDSAPFLLTTLEQKADLLAEHGVETTFALPFNRRLSMLSPADFVDDILGRVLGLAGIAVGAEFCFGRKRSGTAEDLRRLATEKSIRSLIIEPVAADGEDQKYASSAARQALRDGEPEKAASILGRPFTVEGVVQKGQQLGRTLDFPTANLPIGPLIHPAKGVYAVTARVRGEMFRGVANFGERPTVDGTGVLLEVHLFDFARDIYGETLRVSLHHFLRREQKFDSLDALKTQIAADGKQAASLLAALS